MNIKITASQVQKQILAPSMQQSIEILLLPLAELSTTIDQEIENNPLLEMAEERPADHDTDRKRDNESVNHQLEKLMRDREILYYSNQAWDDDFNETRPITFEETYESKLLRELRIAFSSPLEHRIGELIIGNLDEDGFLTITIEEIANILETQDIDLIEKVLKTIQSFGPPGIASRDLKECLLAQVASKLNGTYNYAVLIINNCLTELGKKQYPKIAKKLKLPLETVKKTARDIAKLDPKPARNFRPIKANTYVNPDMFILKNNEDQYHTVLSRESLPKMRINVIYKNMLKNAHLSKTDRDYIKEKMTNAIDFIRSIEQRGHTLKAIGEVILSKQKAFFDHGYQHLAPMCLKDVAQVIGRNESTVSRAINGKYIDTPQGLFPLKFFFSLGIETTGEYGVSNVSRRSLKEEIKRLINEEDKSHPISDQDIAQHFKKNGMTIARRTVTKYRKILHILPTHLRKE